MIKQLRRRMSMLVIGVLVIVSIGIVIAIYEVNNQNIISQAESALDALAENSGVRPSLPELDPGAGGEAPPGGGENETPPPKPESESLDADPDDAGVNTDALATPPPKPEEDDDGKSSFSPLAGNSGKGRETTRPAVTGSNDTGSKPGSRATPGRGGNPPGGDPGARRMERSRSMSSEEVASLSNYYTITLDESGQIQSWESDRADLYHQETLQEFAAMVLESGKTTGRFGTQFFRLLSQEDGTSMLIVLDARLEMLAGWQVLRTTALVAGIACVLLSFGAWLLIRRMVRPVEEAFTKQQQFVWDASHELKTPLAVISANADVLAGEIGENEYLGYIQSEVHRTDSLVKNLLTLARMDRGTVDQDRKDMDLSEAVMGVLLPFESTVFEAGKTLESDIQENVHVLGNEAMLQQLTVILLSNALKYSDAHGVIRVSVEKKTRGAELRVENTGEGIGPRDLDRIFDRFYRTDASRNSETGGEGLGLAIAKSIADIHHGKIRVESEPGKRTAFIVNLP